MLQINREVEVIKKRTNEDLFLPDVDALRKEIVRLRSLHVDGADLQLVDIDRRAVQPSAPVKPKKLIIIIIACVLGAFIGIGIALVREFIQLKRVARRSMSQSLDLTAEVLPVGSAKGLPLD